ncbi:pyrimidine/purine nucleoside phosphorylase [Oscillatoria laete-virens NRMC-F 0139]|nr:pyrimidine/purine nucleoside phosphorylase [Oscillatoria laete-virens NRMC-F 0139]
MGKLVIFAAICSDGRLLLKTIKLGKIHMSIPAKFENVTVACKANVYFDGKVISHTIHLPDGTRKTLGLIYPGTYRFDTGAPELMEMTAGDVKVRLAGQETWTDYPEGSTFEIPGQSSFEISVEKGLAQYICTFL